MFTFNTPVYFNEDDGSGAGTGGEPPVTDAPPDQQADLSTPPPDDDSQQAPPEQPVDWAARITEWGGEDEVQAALGLRDALRTRDGVEALLYEAAGALGVGHDKVRELLGAGQAAPDPGRPEPVDIDALLADPDRVLTAGEVAQLFEAQRRQDQEAQRRQAAAVSLASAVDTTFTDLKVADAEDRETILRIADGYLNVVPGVTTPEQVEQAVRKAHAAFQDKVRRHAEDVLRERHQVHEQLPSPLPAAGGGSGGQPLAEPQTVAEAKARVRASMRS